MSRLEEARREAERRLEESRRAAEERLADVRAAVESEFGVVPRRGYMALALLAGAAGFAVAFKGLGGRKRKRKRIRS
jgi:ferric-dicitrate binding protein FerR (iron transport regulator)